MCLPFGPGGFNMQPMVNPSDAALMHKQRLYIVLICHIVLAVLFLVAFGLMGLFELILCAIFYCGIAQMNYCQLIIYQIICLIGLFQRATDIGLLLQIAI